MNILPKKSWHVRNKDNIDRVNRDEEKARQEEIERQRRVALAEQEARTDVLRQRARQRTGQVTSSSSSKAVTHVDFFSDLQDKKTGNKEYEAEKKEEQEKAEKAIGLLTYLGQSAIEAQTSKPWYLKSKSTQDCDEKEDPVQKKRKAEFDARQKASMDPMRDMAQYMDVKKPKSSKKMRMYEPILSTRPQESPASAKQSSGPKSIEQLRAERLKREKEERAKTEKLLAKLRGEKVEEEKPPVDEREMRYNSQFNPDFVRKRKHRNNYH